MPIVVMAQIPGYIYPVERVLPRARPQAGARRVRKPVPARGRRRFDWRALLADLYPVVGLLLIVGYVLWAVIAGEYAGDWPAPAPATE